MRVEKEDGWMEKCKVAMEEMPRPGFLACCCCCCMDGVPGPPLCIAFRWKGKFNSKIDLAVFPKPASTLILDFGR